MHNKLQEDVTAVKGIGEETAKNLKQLNIETIQDLLDHFPFRYEDNQVRSLNEVAHEERITVEGIVHSEPTVAYYGRRRSRLIVRLLVEQVLVQVVFFNQAYLKNKFNLNEKVTVIGKWDGHRQTITASGVRFGENTQKTDFAPVYHVTEKISLHAMRRWIKNAYDEFGHLSDEVLPQFLIERYRLYDKKNALRAAHFPRSAEEIKQARRRFVYEEFLLFQLKMQALRKIEREQSKGTVHTYEEEKLTRFIASLPFSLTHAQTRVTTEILADMTSPYRMNRLLQGDVGSGKTVVASICLYAAILSGYQGALMVPTEILAEQHTKSLVQLFERTEVRVEMLTSSVKGKRRKELLADLSAGKIHILIGTHALIQEEVVFQRLGLVITDEQHRFGVEQRRVLREKGTNPDVLFMTATPIPRTLAITVFGEMDVSIIDEMPAGRKTIETYWAQHHMLDRVLSFMEKQLVQGQQAYVICPLIEESEKIDVQNAIDVHTSLVQFFRGKYEVGLMHGRLHPDEKEAVMQSFTENKIQVLVSTTVVEVGVNVPNATFMLIYDAERFGLAQLHQLRGRVGRGSEQSYCVLLADPKSEVGKERMRIMTETNDGFILSEKDLELRGAGDFFGKKQSGLPHFKMGDVVHDFRALETARNDAVILISSDAFWQEEQYESLRAHLEQSGVLQSDKLD